MTIFIILLSFAAAILAVFGSRIIRHDTARIMRYGAYADEFYKNCEIIIKTPNIPSDMVQTLTVLNDYIVSSKNVNLFLLIFMNTWAKRRKERLNSSKVSGGFNHFFAKHPDVERAFGLAAYSAIWAISYRGRWLGPLVRLSVLNDLKNDNTKAEHMALWLKQTRNLNFYGAIHAA